MSERELWREAAQQVYWYEAPQQLLDDSNPPFYRWFPDGVTNACYNALDIHVAEGRGEQAALRTEFATRPEGLGRRRLKKRGP